MKLLAIVFLASFALTQTSAKAQTKTGTTTHTATHAARTGGAGSCVPVGTLSPKIPALPAGASCPKALYTLTVIPTAKLDNVSPMEDATALRESFGLNTTSITLAYVDTKVGAGPIAARNKYYSVLYTGYLSDGTEFDSSAKHGGDPLVIPYGKRAVIMGWDTGLDGMHVGGKRRLFIPYQLGYGPQGHPPSIPAKSELIFDVEFVAQSDTPPAPKTPPTPPVSATPRPSSATPSTAPGTMPGHADDSGGGRGSMPAPAAPAAPTPPPAAQPAPAAKPQ